MRSRFHTERSLVATGIETIAGVDEAGRGPLAGPVVAAAVVFPVAWIQKGLPYRGRGIDDSKKLSPAVRDYFFEWLVSQPDLRYGIAIVESEEIDQVNILRASHAAMVRALQQIDPPPAHVLVDGLRVAAIDLPQTAIVGGDALSYSIGAASILAKVTRDRIMIEHHDRWPEYGFAVHKGYPTPAHFAALARHGPCPIHRRSFSPVDTAQLCLNLGLDTPPRLEPELDQA